MDITKTHRIRLAEKDEAAVTIEPEIEETYEEKYKKIFLDLKTRLDKRKLDEHRLIFMSCGVTEDCSGSSYIEMSSTKVVCGVVGPLEMQNPVGYSEEGRILCEVSYANIHTGIIGWQDPSDISKIPNVDPTMAGRLQNALEAVVCLNEFPNFQINVSFLVLEADGSCFAAALMAASLAIADARLPMHDLVSAVTVGIHGDVMLVDLNEKEEKFCSQVSPPQGSNGDKCFVSVACMYNLEQIVDYCQYGESGFDVQEKMIPCAMDKCRQLANLQQQVLIKSLTKGLNDNSNADKPNLECLKDAVNQLNI